MNVFGFGTTSKSSITKYIDKLKDDIVIQTKSLIKQNPQGYKLTVLQDTLNNKYFEYENLLQENKVNLKLINQFKTDCFALKELMEENYLKNRNDVCADVLTTICTNHNNDIITMDIDDLDENEIQRRFDINYNMLSAKLYNSIGGWTFDNDDQMHNMVKETLDIIKEEQAKRLNELKSKRLQDLRQSKLNNELKNIEHQKKRQKKETTSEEESGPFSSKRTSLAEQQQKAREFVVDNNKSSKKKEPILLKSNKSVLDDIDDESPRPTSSSKKRKSLDDIEDHEPIIVNDTKVKDNDTKANKLLSERRKAQHWKLEALNKEQVERKQKPRQSSPPPPPSPPKPEVKESKSKKDVLAEARAAAAAAMEERLKAALPTSSANKSSKKSSKKK